MDTGSLTDILPTSPQDRLTEPQIARILCQVLRGLAYLHKSGMNTRSMFAIVLFCNSFEDYSYALIP